MKRGRKKIEKNETDSRYPESEESGALLGESDDSGSFKSTSEMIGGNPNGINAIRALQMIAGGIAAVVMIWFVLRFVLHIL